MCTVGVTGARVHGKLLSQKGIHLLPDLLKESERGGSPGFSCAEWRVGSVASMREWQTQAQAVATAGGKAICSRKEYWRMGDPCVDVQECL